MNLQNLAEKAPKIATHAPRHKQSAAVQPAFVPAKTEGSFFGLAHNNTTAFIQPQLQISKPGDPFEEEADRTADKVMRMAEPATVSATSTPPEDSVQRKCAHCEEEEKVQRKENEDESVQRKEEDEEIHRKGEDDNIQPSPRFVSSRTGTDDNVIHRKEEEDDVQPKLFVNASGALVQRMEGEEEGVQTKAHDDAHIQRKEEENEEQHVQPKLNFIQRQHDEEDVQAKDIHLSRKDRGPPAVSPRFEQNLHSNTGSGRPMDGGTRQFMESRFNADFSGVKVHTDNHAVQMSSGINAQAFTHGQNIYFNSGKYNPDTGAGMHLLAHELTHTIQQGAAKSVQPFLQTKKLARSAGPSAFASVSKKENACGGKECKGDSDYGSEGLIQRKENNTATPPVRPELKRAVTYATSQIGKVDAGKKNDDGTRKGWERLREYFQTAMGEDKVIPDGGVQIPNSILEKNIKYSSTIKAPQPNKPITDEWKKRDAMPSWCGIFVWWSLIKGGVPMAKWKLGEGVKLKAAYPPGYIPKAGDIAYFNTNSHYAIVEKTEPENPAASDKKNVKVSTVNGNTAGEDNLGGQVQIKQHPLSHWAGFFNPLFGLEDKLPKDPAEVSEAELQKILADAGVAGAAVNGGSIAPSTPAEIKAYTPSITVPPATSVAVPTATAPTPTEGEMEGEEGKAAVPEVAPVEASSPQTKEDDPAYQKIVKGAGGVKAKQKTHDAPESKAAAAQMASTPEEKLDKDSQAQMHQVGAMNLQEAKLFNAAAFKQQLMDRIKSALPKDDDEAKERFYESPSKGRQDMAEAAGNMKGDVAAEKQKAGNAITATANAPPNTALAVAKPVVPLQNEDAGAKPYVPNGQEAAPKPKTDAEISLEKDSAQIDQTMASSNVTEKQLEKSNEPEFNKALDGKRSSQQHATETPNNYRQQEGPTLTKAEQQAKGQVDSKVAGMHDARADAFGKVDASKGGTKGKDEAKRKEISENLQRIYNDTKAKVDNGLNALETSVTKQFEEAAKAANKVFEDKVREKLDDHYGILNTIAEFVTGEMSPEVAKIFKDEKERFVASMDTVINSIAAEVETGLNAAMQAIKDGKAEIDKYWSSLGPDLQKIGEDAKNEVLGKFDELEQSVKDKHDQLVEKLGDSYVKNLTALNETFDKLKTEAKGLLGAALDAIGEVIRTIIRMKDMLLDTLRKAAHVIGDIIADPIGFLSNLITAVKMGINAFVDNIWTHLKKGFFEWLMGAMPPGIQFPEKWDGAGIFHFVMQILGLTYVNIRGRTIKKLNQVFGGGAGEKIVAVLEEAFEIFQIIRKEGLPGLWKYIVQKVGDLKVMVIDAIQNFLIEKIVKAGITWIIGLLNPAGAFIKACKLIYDVIMFFVNNGKRILDLINAVLDSIANIVAGNLTGAAKMVEDALARIIPITIGFLASLLGLDGISEKVQKIIHAIQSPINKAIDWVIDKAIALARKLGIDKLVKKVKGSIDKGKDWAKKKVEQAKEKTISVMDSIKEFLGIKQPFTTTEGEKHTLYLEEKGGNLELMMASTPTKFRPFVSKIDAGNDDKKKEAKTKAVGIAGIIDGLLPKVRFEKDKEARKKLRSDLKQALKDLSDQVKLLFAGKSAPTGNSKKEAIPMSWYKPRNSYPKTITLEDRYKGLVTIALGQSEQIAIPDPDILTRSKKATRAETPSLRKRDEGGGGSFTVGVSYIPEKDHVLMKNRSYREALRTEPQRSFRSLMEICGRDMRKTNEDADHVLDLQFQGIDDFINMWPLNATVNRSAMQFGEQPVTATIDNEVTILPLNDSRLVGKYFIIKETRLF